MHPPPRPFLTRTSAHEAPPPPAGLVGEIAPQELIDHPGQMLRGGGEQVWLPGPRGSSVQQGQVEDCRHTA